MKSRQPLTLKLPTIQHLFLAQLVIISVMETLVHFFMPLLIPDTHKAWQGITDALVLTLASAPFVWAIIARPLRAVAISESTRTQTVLESVVEAVICFNGEGRIESLNPAAERMFGWQTDEIVGQLITKVIPESSEGTCYSGGGMLADHETFGLHRDGRTLPVVVSISKMPLGRRPLLAAIIHDITERRQAAAALEEQRQFSLKLVQDSSVPCFVLAPDHKVLVWNKSCEELTGIRSAEIVGTNDHWKAFYDQRQVTLADVVLDGDDHGLYADCRKSAFAEGGLQREGWFHNIRGKDRYLFFDAVPMRNDKGEIIAVIETLEDITERKIVEESLKKSEEKFFKAFHASPDGIVINTRDEGLFIEANEVFFKMLGYAREELIGQSSLELGIWVDPGERARIIARTKEEGAVRNVEITIRVKSGAIRTFLWSSDVIELNNKDCLLVIVRDITAQKENERQLLRSKSELICKHEQLSALFSQVESVKREWEKTMDCINDIVILLDQEGSVKRCNRAAIEFVGLPCGEIIGQNWQGLLELPGMPEIGSLDRHLPCEFHDDRLNKWLLLTYYPDSKQGTYENTGAVVTIHDITGTKQVSLELARAYTELKDTHSQMIRQEKMASIGQLAAGVAHEINNPTGFIISNLGSLGKYNDRLVEFINAQQEAISMLDASEQEKFAALRRRLKIDHIIGDLPDLINESLDGADRIKNIVQSLKGFSRKDGSEPTMANIVDCLESTINIIWNEIKYKASLKKEFGDLPAMRCYPQNLSQVFMNLIVNAAHAIKERGEITVRTWQEHDAAYIAVTDNGSGIPEEIQGRIFEPFFTTKESGKGTGLGLSISYEIVRKHGGEITVESVVGTGTTFTVMLPIDGVQQS